MSDYGEMTNADVMSGEEMHEYDQRAEALLDAEDELRWAAEDSVEPAGHADDEPGEDLADDEEH